MTCRYKQWREKKSSNKMGGAFLHEKVKKEVSLLKFIAGFQSNYQAHLVAGNSCKNPKADFHLSLLLKKPHVDIQ